MLKTLIRLVITPLFLIPNLPNIQASDPENGKAPPRHVVNDEPMAKWVKQLSDPDAAKADQAMMKLLVLGQPAIDELMKAVESKALFQGFGMQSEYDQTGNLSWTVGYVCLYLIRSICSPRAKAGHKRFLFQGSNEVLETSAYFKSDPYAAAHPERYTDASIAVKVYRQWYEGLLDGSKRIEDIDEMLRAERFYWGGL